MCVQQGFQRTPSAPADQKPQGRVAGRGLQGLPAASQPRPQRRRQSRVRWGHGADARALCTAGEGQRADSRENVTGEQPCLPGYAVCTFPLTKPKNRGAGGEFHKVNPENTEGVGGGESSDSPRMFRERCFLLSQQQKFSH